MTQIHQTIKDAKQAMPVMVDADVRTKHVGTGTQAEPMTRSLGADCKSVDGF